MDIYLDATTNLPVAIDFNEHPDFAVDLNTPVEILYSGWKPASGIQAPSQIQKFRNGSLSLELTNLTVTVNTSIPQTDFSM